MYHVCGRLNWTPKGTPFFFGGSDHFETETLPRDQVKSVVLDSNWRWIHNGQYTNCYKERTDRTGRGAPVFFGSLLDTVNGRNLAPPNTPGNVNTNKERFPVVSKCRIWSIHSMTPFACFFLVLAGKGRLFKARNGYRSSKTYKYPFLQL